MENNMGKISDLELENVAGGKTCHSKGTYESLGIPTAELAEGQMPPYHPVITTLGNWCKLHSTDKTGGCHMGCHECTHHHCKGPTTYCTARSKEVDKSKQ